MSALKFNYIVVLYNDENNVGTNNDKANKK